MRCVFPTRPRALATATARAVATLLLVFLSGCATVSLDYPREASYALDPTTPTTLKREVDEWRSVNPGPSGFYPLVDGNDAMGARLRLMAQAEQTIDIQYFLMKPDTAGLAFAAGILEAADRGVRVRFLLDDIFTTVDDPELMLLDRHANVEVRLFNPIARRGVLAFNFLGDFKRANRRMHNKSFTVDNQVTIVGGRNIADEYFGIKTDGEFIDLDVLAIGPVAAKVSKTFDLFWNDARAFPLESVAHDFSDDALDQAFDTITEADWLVAADATSRSSNAPLVQQLFDGEIPLYSAESSVITDDPEKLGNPIDTEYMVIANELAEAVQAAQSEVIVLTPYFVPGRDGVAFWTEIAARGVRVVIVTNSLKANNHTPVHSAYAKYRKPVIRGGIELYEVRADATRDPGESLTMHAKGIVIDRSRAFIGSLNVDPRSLEINTEMGLMIESPELATNMAKRIDEQLVYMAWRVDLDERGKLTWTTEDDGQPLVATSEPGAGTWLKIKAFFMKIVPENQL